jgi:hypothetical protein
MAKSKIINRATFLDKRTTSTKILESSSTNHNFKGSNSAKFGYISSVKEKLIFNPKVYPDASTKNVHLGPADISLEGSSVASEKSLNLS